MPVLDQIASALGGNIAEGVADIIKLFKVDPNLALEKQVEIQQIQATLQGKVLDTVSAQIGVDRQEAASSSVFVAGWRPFVGWACGFAFVYAFIIQPSAQTIAVFCHSGFDITKLPKMDIAQMMPVLLGMLGLGAMRSFDKTQGTDNGH